jgi:hypothetical protein
LAVTLAYPSGEEWGNFLVQMIALNFFFFFFVLSFLPEFATRRGRGVVGTLLVGDKYEVQE